MQIQSQLAALRRNINAGTRLSLLRRTAVQDFSVSLDQLVLLIILNFMLAFVIEFACSLPGPAFNPHAVAANALDVLLFLFAAYMVSRLLMGQAAFLRLGIYVYSMSPFIFLCYALLGQLGELLPPHRMQLYGLLYLGVVCDGLGIYPGCRRLLPQGPGRDVAHGAGLDGAGLLFRGRLDALVRLHR